jgi:DNA repair exonuclease SbcCD ATPase subunit
MRVSRIKISDILGIEELEFEPGAFTTISGTNGSGKTSVLEAIKSVVKGGTDATLLRNGAKDGEIILVLDDETQIRKRVTAKSSTVTVERDGAIVREPMSTIRAITDMLSVNPVEFLAARPKDRTDVLLESLPIKADPKRLSKIAGFEVHADSSDHALVLIDRLQREIFDDRTATNRALRDKRATVQQLEGTLPAPGEPGATGDLPALEAAKAQLDAAKEAEFERVRLKLNEFRKTADEKTEAVRANMNSVREVAAQRIEAIRVQMQADIDALTPELTAIQDWLVDAERKAGIQREKTVNRHAEGVAPIMAEISALRSSQGAAARAQQTRETIALIDREGLALRADSDRQTKALEDLAAYKAELLENLPIQGLTVQDGEIMRDGVVFDRLNTAQQVEIAVDIAKLRAGALGVICVDGLENLDTAHFEAFKAQAIKSGLQLIVSRVSDGDFAVQTQG